MPVDASDASPVCMPIRTRSSSPAGQGWARSSLCISSAAATDALGEVKKAKNESPRVPLLHPFERFQARADDAVMVLEGCGMSSVTDAGEQRRRPFDVREPECQGLRAHRSPSAADTPIR